MGRNRNRRHSSFDLAAYAREVAADEAAKKAKAAAEAAKKAVYDAALREVASLAEALMLRLAAQVAEVPAWVSSPASTLAHAKVEGQDLVLAGEDWLAQMVPAVQSGLAEKAKMAAQEARWEQLLPVFASMGVTGRIEWFDRFGDKAWADESLSLEEAARRHLEALGRDAKALASEAAVYSQHAESARGRALAMRDRENGHDGCLISGRTF